MRSSLALFGAFLVGAVLFGQTQAEISGEVTDSSGSAVVWGDADDHECPDQRGSLCYLEQFRPV
jgi:hypothetical protein